MQESDNSKAEPIMLRDVKNSVQDRAALVGIVSLYAVFAALWIFFSDRALESFADSATIARLSTLKGLVFVVITSSLLYLLLKSRHAPSDGATHDQPKVRRLALFFAAHVLIVPLIGLLIFKLQYPQIEREAYANLQAIVQLKASQIENWLDERRGDSQALAHSQGLVEQVVKLQAGGRLEQQVLVRNQLEAMRQAYAYAAVMLVDAKGWPLLALGEQAGLADATKLQVVESLASGEVQHTDLWRDQGGQAHIDFIVPLLREGKDERQPVGAVVLRVYPEAFLFPLIQNWPTASPSAETLLVRHDNESLVFLNELRHRKDTALTLAFPFAGSNLPAAYAVRAQQPGTVAGKDYRAVDVFSAYRPIAGTNWHLIAKVDRAEVLAPLWSLVFWVCLVAFAALVAIGVALQLLWRQQQRVQRLQFVMQKDAALREGELRYRAVTESSSDAIISADSAGNIVAWNAAAEQLFGYSAAEFGGQPLALLMPQRFQERHVVGMRRLLAGGTPQVIGKTVEQTGRHKSGAEFPLELSLAQWAMAGRQFFTGTMRDISERKANEARLQRLTRVYATLSQCNQSIVSCASEEELFSQICCDAVDFGGMKMAWVGLIDPTTQVVRPIASFGASAEAYLHDIEVSIDAASPLGCGPIGTALREAHPVWNQDFLNDPSTAPWHARGVQFGWGAVAALPLYRSGVVIGAFCLYTAETHPFDEAVRNLLLEMAVDISLALDGFAREAKRIEAEEHTRRLLAENEAILKNALVGIVHLKDRRVVSCNRRFEEIFCYASGELVGQSSELFFESPALFNEVSDRAYGALCNGKSYSEEVMFRRKDGSSFWGALNGRAIDTGHPLDGSIWIYADISERVRLDEQLHNQQLHLEVLVQKRTADLETALEAAKLADVAKDAFLANVSHELRTPLNAVIGMADLARRLSHDPAQQAYLDKVGNAGKTLAHLINDLLDLSKIVAGRLEFEKTTFSLHQLVERCDSVMSYKASEKGLQLMEKIADDVPDLLVGDPLRIEQILLNLLSNAVKFTAAGRVEVRIGVHERQAGRICLVVEVEDSGVGLRAEEIARLFQPFIQADTSMTRKYGGTGLGLAICKRLAEMMGGQIGVSSQAGQGSTFRVSFWLELGRPEDLAATEQPAEQVVPLRYRSAQVLVVDDQPLNREIAEALLKFVGISPRMAGDGQQAIDILNASGSGAFDLVLMDVQMPIMDGLTATRMLRAQGGFEALPIIAMTAHTMAHEKEISAKAGMNDHIGKPFDNPSFYRTLARWLPVAKQQVSGEVSDGAAPASPVFSFIKDIDTEGGIARFAGSELRYRHWLTDFVEEGPAAALQIRQALALGRTEAARQVAHAFKGRVGMLGMNALHDVVSALEAALKQGEPVEGWLGKLEQVIEQTCLEIKRALDLPTHVPELQPATLDRLPQGPMPATVTHLLELLDAGDGGSAAAIARCLEQLKDSAWAPHLQQALALAQNFDFVAARQRLVDDSVSPADPV